MTLATEAPWVAYSDGRMRCVTAIRTDELTSLCVDALLRVGAGQTAATILAEATVAAELLGNRAVGVAHLFDYLAGYRDGRIAVDAHPAIRRAAAAILDADAGEGLAQVAFAEARALLAAATADCGMAALWIRNSFTCGELGYYARSLAQQGFLALAAATSPALMSVGGAPHSVLGTNPIAYAVPRPGRLPLVIDQASSATAFVNVRAAAAAGKAIPPGWALGPDGEPTEDAAAALRGTLLPFGGHRGGNVALLVELLATLSGASFSLDSPPFDRGSQSPGIGVFLLSIDPAVFGGSLDRIARYLRRLAEEHGVRLPALDVTVLPDAADVDPATLDRLRQAAGSTPLKRA